MTIPLSGAKNSSAPSASSPYKSDFCTETAKQQIKDLNNQAKDKITEIGELKGEVNNLNAQRILIGGYLKMKDDYFKSIESFSKNETEADTANLKNADASAFRQLINTSLAMSLVNNIAEAGAKAAAEAEAKIAASPDPVSNIPVKTIKELCLDESNKKIQNSNFCTKFKLPEITTEQSNALEKIYSDVSMAFDKVPASEKLQTYENLKKIYATIPPELAPDKIIADLIAPSAIATSEADEDRHLINSCFGGRTQTNKKTASDESCKALMANPVKMEQFKNIFFGQVNEAHKAIMEKKLATLTVQLEENDKLKNAKTGVKSAIKNQLNYLNDPKNQSRLSKIGLTSANLEEFNKNCSNPDDSLKELCKTNANNIIAILVKQNTELEKNLQEKIEKLNKIVDPTGELYKLEQLTQFVQTKYLRTCSNVTIDNNEYSSIITCQSKLSGISEKAEGDTDQITTLNTNLSNIVTNLQPGNISASQAELGAFTKAELDSFKNICGNNSLKSETIEEICLEINKESNRIANQKESAEWAAFNKKYWVKRNESNSKGYDVYEKKIPGRIIGDGLVQITGQIAPMIIGNMNMNYQIDMMTNQAIYMKQMNYMNDPNSSWMMNNSYFQGNYYNQNTPFTGFDATTINTTTPAGTGFNFSN